MDAAKDADDDVLTCTWTDNECYNGFQSYTVGLTGGLRYPPLSPEERFRLKEGKIGTDRVREGGSISKEGWMANESRGGGCGGVVALSLPPRDGFCSRRKVKFCVAEARYSGFHPLACLPCPVFQ